MAYPKKNIIIVFAIAVVIILSAVIIMAWPLATPKTVLVAINNNVIKAETADSVLTQYHGLSNRPSLCPDCGMLFNFPDFQEREFVMRDMEFPLDIIFIADGKIINIAANLPPEGHEPSVIYKSNGPADQVLEVNGGYAEQKGIKVGDMITINQ